MTVLQPLLVQNYNLNYNSITTSVITELQPQFLQCYSLKLLQYYSLSFLDRKNIHTYTNNYRSNIQHVYKNMKQ